MVLRWRWGDAHSAHQLLVHRHANSRSRVPFHESAADSPCSEWCACFRLTTPLVCMRSHAVRQWRRSAPISSLCSNLGALRSATPAVFSGFPPSHTFRVSCRIVLLSNNKLGGEPLRERALGHDLPLDLTLSLSFGLPQLFSPLNLKLLPPPSNS